MESLVGEMAFGGLFFLRWIRRKRSSNEKLNGVIQQFNHKGIDFNEFFDCLINKLEQNLNQQPRKDLAT